MNLIAFVKRLLCEDPPCVQKFFDNHPYLREYRDAHPFIFIYCVMFVLVAMLLLPVVLVMAALGINTLEFSELGFYVYMLLCTLVFAVFWLCIGRAAKRLYEAADAQARMVMSALWRVLFYVCVAALGIHAVSLLIILIGPCFYTGGAV